MAEYIRALWHHQHTDEPIEMLYEVLLDQTVPRMVEFYAAGRAVANTLALERERYPTFVGRSLISGAMSTIEDINSSGKEFEAFAIEQSEFENAFNKATPMTIDANRNQTRHDRR